MRPSPSIEEAVDEDDLIGEEFNPMTMHTPKEDLSLIAPNSKKLQYDLPLTIFEVDEKSQFSLEIINRQDFLIHEDNLGLKLRNNDKNSER